MSWSLIISGVVAVLVAAVTAYFKYGFTKDDSHADQRAKAFERDAKRYANMPVSDDDFRRKLHARIQRKRAPGNQR